MFQFHPMAQQQNHIEDVIFRFRMEQERQLSNLRIYLSSLYLCNNSPYNINMSLPIAPGLSSQPPLPEEILRKKSGPQKDPPPTVCSPDISPPAEVIINSASTNNTIQKIRKPPKKKVSLISNFVDLSKNEVDLTTAPLGPFPDPANPVLQEFSRTENGVTLPTSPFSDPANPLSPSPYIDPAKPLESDSENDCALPTENVPLCPFIDPTTPMQPTTCAMMQELELSCSPPDQILVQSESTKYCALPPDPFHEALQSESEKDCTPPPNPDPEPALAALEPPLPAAQASTPLQNTPPSDDSAPPDEVDKMYAMLMKIPEDKCLSMMQILM